MFRTVCLHLIVYLHKKSPCPIQCCTEFKCQGTYVIDLLCKSNRLRESSRNLLGYLILFLNVVHHVVYVINVSAQKYKELPVKILI